MNERITTAGIAIKDGKVLAAKRIEGGALSGKWEFPGGKNRWGESVEDTLVREWKEELGVGISVGKGIFSYDFQNGDTLYHLRCCLVAPESDSFVLSVHTEIRYVSPGELDSLDFGGSDRAIADFLRHSPDLFAGDLAH